jgi:hypothetical protein
MQVADPIPQVAPPKPFVAPTITSRLVHWYPHADTKSPPVPALVHSVNRQGAVTMIAFPLNNNVGRSLHGVLHVDDPQLKRLTDAATFNGGWDLTPEDKAVQARLTALESRFAEIDKGFQEQQKFIDELNGTPTPSKSKK